MANGVSVAGMDSLQSSDSVIIPDMIQTSSRDKIKAFPISGNASQHIQFSDIKTADSVSFYETPSAYVCACQQPSTNFSVFLPT